MFGGVPSLGAIRTLEVFEMWAILELMTFVARIISIFAKGAKRTLKEIQTELRNKDRSHRNQILPFSYDDVSFYGQCHLE